MLVASLANPTNSYSRQRLTNYGFETRGWDALPIWNPRSAPVTRDVADALAHGARPTLPDATAPLWNGRRPTTMRGWIDLGRDVFFGYPLRAEVFMEFALAHPELTADVGVQSDGAGLRPGLRVFADVDGRVRVGITCAVCHSSVRDGDTVVGAARRAFDYGRLRLIYYRTTREPVDPELARRMERWGPGRADVTEDEAEDPVAIPDLWGLRAQTALTQAGTIRHVAPSALAIRQETQLLDSNHQRVRPPRELAWALAMYLYALEPPAHPEPRDPREAANEVRAVSAGRALFVNHCHDCHSNAAFGGRPVPYGDVGTNAALATGAARGTGRYRPPPLVNVRDAAPYLHDGAVPTLEDLLNPDRLSSTYSRGPLGAGAVPGHTYGTDWSAGDRAAVVAYLRSL